MFKHIILTIMLCAVAVMAHASPWNSDKDGFLSKGNGAVIKGYDPVSYFADNKAVMGNPEIASVYKGGTFFFANEDHKKQFESEPQKFAPQYGGYCAYAIGAKNELVEVDPTAFSVFNDKLYLNYDKSIQKEWESDKENYIRSGDINWPAHQ